MRRSRRDGKYSQCHTDCKHRASDKRGLLRVFRNLCWGVERILKMCVSHPVSYTQREERDPLWRVTRATHCFKVNEAVNPIRSGSQADLGQAMLNWGRSGGGSGRQVEQEKVRTGSSGLELPGLVSPHSWRTDCLSAALKQQVS